MSITEDPITTATDEDGPAEAGDLVELFCDVEGCAFTTYSSAGLARHKTRSHKPAGPEDPPPAAPGAEGPADGRPERPPSVPRRGLGSRLRDRLARRGSPPAGPGTPKPPRPKRPVVSSKNRISVAADIARGYSWAGRNLEYTPFYPVGRMLTYQALGAGPLIDDALVGSQLDRYVVQPLARTADKWRDVGALTCPPALIFIMCQIRQRQIALVQVGRQEEAEQLEGTLRFWGSILEGMLRSMLIRLGPGITEARERQAAEDEAIREAFPDLPPDIDPVRALLSMLFESPGSEGAVNVGHVNGNGSPAGQSPPVGDDDYAEDPLSQ